jgi:hypothetical protein
VRNGGWNGGHGSSRVTVFRGDGRDSRTNFTGFRLARTLAADAPP